MPLGLCASLALYPQSDEGVKFDPLLGLSSYECPTVANTYWLLAT